MFLFRIKAWIISKIRKMFGLEVQDETKSEKITNTGPGPAGDIPA